MSNEQSTGTIAVSKPAKSKGKSPLEKLQAKYDKLDKGFDSLQADHDELHDKYSLELQKTRSLEAQIRNAADSKESAGHDTTRVANAILTSNLLVKLSSGKQEMPSSYIDMIIDELTKDLTLAALQIQAH